MKTTEKQLITAKVHGMCGGVFAALKILDDALQKHCQEKVYVFHELVHNRAVTEEFKSRGAVFVETLEEIPAGAVVVIGAHGVSVEMEHFLRDIAGECLDATCPLVKKLHRIASELSCEEELIIFGNPLHPEVKGIAGNSGTQKIYIISSLEEAENLPDLQHPVFISQTTVDFESVDKTLQFLKKRFPGIKSSTGVCDASQKRQTAVIELAKKADLVLVIGSAHSSNAKRLRDIAGRYGAKAFLVENADALPWNIIQQAQTVGVTSGASTPEYLFEEVISALKERI